MSAYYVDTNNIIHLVTAHYDSDYIPRDDSYMDRTGTMVVSWNRDWYGDADADPGEYICNICDENDIEYHSLKDAVEELEKRGYMIRPLYIYEHSGMSISMAPFGDRWDSGMAGFFILEPEEVKDFGSRENAEKFIKEEVHEYDCCLQGEVYTVCDEELTNQAFILANPYHMVRGEEEWEGDFSDMFFGDEDEGIAEYCKRSSHLFWSVDYEKALDFARKNVNKGVVEEGLKDKIYTVTVTETREITINILSPNEKDAAEIARFYANMKNGDIVSTGAKVVGVKNEF